VSNTSFSPIFKALAVASVALCSTGAKASNSWAALEIIDMTTATQFIADVVETADFLPDINLSSLDEPALSLASNGFEFDTTRTHKSGWAGLVEVEVDEEPTLPFDEISSFSDTFLTTETEVEMQGFYSMRYQFESTSAFRPYAGAGLGLVTTSTDNEAGGIIAGRATAGFDLTLGEGASLFAEYAVLKNGGVNLGAVGADGATGNDALDIEHSVKLGFRRTF